MLSPQHAWCKTPRFARILVLVLTVALTSALDAASATRSVTSFNEDWRFARYGEMNYGSFLEEPAGLEKASVDDSNWRELRLPHDWAIEGPFRDDLPNAEGKLPYMGIGWYRKTFTVPESDAGKQVFVEFDGAMSHSKVYLNDQYVGEWPYGYSSFRFDLTPHLKVGKENVLAVRLENKIRMSRWYPGAGIYRKVSLVKTAPVHIAHWGTYVTTPEVSVNSATVRIETTVRNHNKSAHPVELRHEVYEAGLKRVKVAETTTGKGSIAPDSTEVATATLELSKPKRWDVESPNLYLVVTSVLQNGKLVDSYETTFGVRTIKFTAEDGFHLNGRRVQLKGVCLHHDLGPLGAAFHTRAMERQLEIMQEMGANAIRTSHNPPAPELLELCDRMGILVIDEAFDSWAKGKTENSYHTLFEEWHEKDIVALVRRDRNHPSIIMWSSGNEVFELHSDEGKAVSQMLTDIFHREDPTRPVTVGSNKSKPIMGDWKDSVDVIGANYNQSVYPIFLEKNPGYAIYGSETSSTTSSRGEYYFPVKEPRNRAQKLRGGARNNQISSYDYWGPGWSITPDKQFELLEKNPNFAGEFVWTGFDYIGEPTPFLAWDQTLNLNFKNEAEAKRAQEANKRLNKGKASSRSSYFGIVDLCGFPKDRYYLYQAHWRPDYPMAHILPHWTWPERIGEITPVYVYTSGDEAELFLNGESLGRRSKKQYEYRLKWNEVKYQPGELKVVAYKEGKPWAEQTMKTAGAPSQLSLSADRTTIKADGDDLSFITVRIEDSEGIIIPQAGDLIQFKITGPGEIIGVGNGDSTNHESFQGDQHSAFNGLCLAIVRTIDGQAGKITIKTRAKGLGESTLSLNSQ